MIPSLQSTENHATAGPFADIAERFPLGNRHGVITPTAESISDTATTPFGLTPRIIPEQRNTVPIRAWETGATMATEKVTEITSDGGSGDVDTRFDVATDI